MTGRIVVAALTVVTLAAAARAEDKPAKNADPKKPDSQAILGEWRVVYKEQNGAPIEQDRNGETWTFEERKFTIRVNKKARAFSYTLDPSKDPKRLDFLPVVPKSKDANTPAIYTLEGDKLTLCAPALGSSARPTAIKTEAWSKTVIVTLQRVKPKPGDTPTDKPADAPAKP